MSNDVLAHRVQIASVLLLLPFFGKQLFQPFAFTGITLHATAATRLHVQLTSTGPDTFTLHAADPTGAPVITIRTLTLRACPTSSSSGPPRPDCKTACSK